MGALGKKKNSEQKRNNNTNRLCSHRFMNIIIFAKK